MVFRPVIHRGGHLSLIGTRLAANLFERRPGLFRTAVSDSGRARRAPWIVVEQLVPFLPCYICHFYSRDSFSGSVTAVRGERKIIEISSRMAASGLSAGGPKADAYRAGFVRADIVTKVCDKLYTPLFAGLFGERFPTIQYKYEFMMGRMIVNLKRTRPGNDPDKWNMPSASIEMTETYYDKQYEIHFTSNNLFGPVTKDSLNEKLVRSIVEEHPDVFREFFYFSKRVFSDTRELSVILEEAVLPPSAAALVEHMTAPSTKVGFEEHMKALYAKVAVEHKRTHDVEQARILEEAQRVYVERQRKLLEAERVHLEREPVAAGGAGGGASAAPSVAAAAGAAGAGGGGGASSVSSSTSTDAPKPTPYAAKLIENINVSKMEDGTTFVAEMRSGFSPYIQVTVLGPETDAKKSTVPIYKINVSDFTMTKLAYVYPDTTPARLAFLESVVSPFRPAAKDASRRSARKRRSSRRTNRRKGTRQRSSKK